jgi:hypothetical protein
VSLRIKLSQTWRAARSFASRLRGVWFPEPLPPAFVEALEEAAAEAELLRLCSCSTRSSNHQVHMDDHEPGCEWLARRCQPCRGSGWCDECGGEGLAPAQEAP